jgi:hypothetical protein
VIEPDPLGIIDRSTGQSFGNASRTLSPPASHTSVTISGGGVPVFGTISGIDFPSGASNPKCSNLASVGATSASVTGRCTRPSAGMMPGPYQNSGTSCR